MNTNKIYIIIAFIILISGITISLYLCKFGINIDEPYQIMNSREYYYSPMSFLSSFIDGFIFKSLNMNWLSIRYYSRIINFLTILTTCLYVFKYKDKQYECVSNASICVLLTAMCSTYFNVYGWDRQSMLHLTICIICFHSYIQKPTIAKLIFLSILSVSTTLCRLPNIAIIPLISLLIFLQHGIPLKNKFVNIVIYFSSSIVILLFSIIIFYDSVNNYLLILSNNTINNHNLSQIIANIISDIFQISCICLVFLVIYKSIKHIDRKFGNLLSLLSVFLFSLLLCAVLIYKTGGYMLFYRKYVLSITIFLASYIILNKETSKQSKFIIVSILCLSFVSTIGSDTGLSKALVLPLIPFLFYFIKPIINNAIKKTAICVFAAAILTNIIYYYKFSFSDSVISLTTAKINNPLAEGILTTKEKAKTINIIDSIISEYTVKNYQPIVIGYDTNRYIFEYLYNSRNEYLRHYWNTNDDLYNDKHYNNYISQCISNKNSIILYLKSNNDRNLIYHNLSNNCILIHSSENYTIFIFKYQKGTARKRCLSDIYMKGTLILPLRFQAS